MRQNICRVFATNNEFPLRGKIGGGAGGRNICLARHSAGVPPAERLARQSLFTAHELWVLPPDNKKAKNSN